jgi:mannan polymerase II complex MNN10 subunit
MISHHSPLYLKKRQTTSHAGVFFIRKSNWSERFLDTWWNQTSFIQFGSTKSGDNAALKHLIDHLSAEEMQAHVRIAKMQCLFNSYPWILSWKSTLRLIFHLATTWKGSRILSSTLLIYSAYVVRVCI